MRHISVCQGKRGLFWSNSPPKIAASIESDSNLLCLICNCLPLHVQARQVNPSFTGVSIDRIVNEEMSPRGKLSMSQGHDVTPNTTHTIFLLVTPPLTSSPYVLLHDTSLLRLDIIHGTEWLEMVQYYP